MGNKHSVVKNNCINELQNIDENNLDISNIDKLQIKAIKEIEINAKLKEMEEKKSDRIMYKLPVQICNYSLI